MFPIQVRGIVPEPGACRRFGNGTTLARVWRACWKVTPALFHVMELEVVALARPSRYESVRVWLARLSGKVTMTAAMPLFPNLALALSHDS